MNISLTKSLLLNFILRQIDNFFPDGADYSKIHLDKYLDIALQRTEYCFSKINLKYYYDKGQVQFNHLNGDQYSMFLYLLSNTLYKNNVDLDLCSKLFALNKTLHGIDAYFEVELPEIFLFVHPLGTVLGRGKYSNYFLVYQRCNIGSNKDIYPIMGEYTSLHPGSAILGSCHLGENCTLAAHALLLDKNLPTNSLYVGNPEGHRIIASNQKKSLWL
jgi:serine O-acetyltransferase